MPEPHRPPIQCMRLATPDVLPSILKSVSEQGKKLIHLTQGSGLCTCDLHACRVGVMPKTKDDNTVLLPKNGLIHSPAAVQVWQQVAHGAVLPLRLRSQVVLAACSGRVLAASCEHNDRA
jgi:hypothetical protein